MTKQEKLKFVEEYRQAKVRMRELEKQYKTIGKDVFKLQVNELFDAHPDLIDFGWRQYTPAFNDGEPCTFRCGADYPRVNGVDEYEDAEEGEYPKLEKKQEKVIRDAVQNLLAMYSSSDMLNLFGDCVKIVITRKGIDTEEYQPY